jgi:hypothetical protein
MAYNLEHIVSFMPIMEFVLLLWAHKWSLYLEVPW